MITSEQNIPTDAVSRAKIQEVLFKPLGVDVLEKLSAHIAESELKSGKVIDLTDYKPKDYHFADLEEDEVAKGLQEASLNENQEGLNETILVIDDNSGIRDLLTRILWDQKYRVITAKNGQEGYEKAVDIKPDLIVVDWMMPVMNGIEFINKLHENEELFTTPTILLTAKSGEQYKLEGHKEGATAFIPKPFDEGELISSIKNLLELKSKERELEELLLYKHKMAEIGELMPMLTHELKNALMEGSISTSSVIDKSNFFEHFNSSFPADLWRKLIYSFFSESIDFHQQSARKKLLVFSEQNQRKEEILHNLTIYLKRLSLDVKDMQRVWQIMLESDYDNLMRMFSLFNLLINLSRLIKSSERVKEIIGSVLNYSRNNENISDISFREIVKSCYNLIEKKIALNEISFKNSVNPDLFFKGNNSEIHQVVLNIIGNSIDALSDVKNRQKEITVGSRMANGRTIFSIQDNGPGIPKENLEKIFNKSFSTKGEKGNGIGLHICKNLVEKNNGQISVSSEKGQTTFLLEFDTKDYS